MYSSTHSLTSALHGGEWSASRPGRFTPRERASGTHWIGGWVGPRAVLDAVKRKYAIDSGRLEPKWALGKRKFFVMIHNRFSYTSVVAAGFCC
jgi:hypothetical protein